MIVRRSLMRVFLVLAGLLTVSALILDRSAAAQSAQSAPSLAVNLNGIEDWSTQHPFINIARTARPWFGHVEGRWGGISNDQLRATGHLNDGGWPKSMPANAVKLETVLFTGQPDDLKSIRGRYRITYDGDVDVVMSGAARNVRYADGEVWFDYPDSAPGLVGVGLTRINPDDPLTRLDIVHEDNIPLFEVGATFNPDWLNRVKDFRVFRFMPWMRTNNSQVQTWADLPKTSDFSYNKGVPLEVMINLANLTGVDPWFTLPHRADDALVQKFAEAVKRDLYPHRKAYFEYSNEIWNFQFEQARWAQNQANELWKSRAGGNAWIQFAGLRAAEIGQMLKAVFAEEAASRLMNVVGVHTGWMDLADVQLDGNLVNRELDQPRSEIFDAYAVTGYLRPDFDAGKTSEHIAEWLSKGGESHAMSMLDKSIRETRLKFLTREAWPNHFERAQKYGLDLIMYEGGTHVIIPYDEELVPEHQELVTAFNFSPYMSQLYDDALEAWRGVGGRLFNAFVDIGPPSRWGSWGHLRHLDDETDRWRILEKWNAEPSGFEPERGGAVFASGQIMTSAGAISSSTLDDILWGSDEDEVFIFSQGQDLIHGGGGFDQLILSGAISDYEFDYEDGRHVVVTNGAKTRFIDIDYIVLPEDGLAILPSDLR